MTYRELLDAIATSRKDDWLFNDGKGVYTYMHDLNLRIVRRDIDHDSDRFFGESWATRHPDKNAYRSMYDIYYGSSFVDEKLLVAVDGYRATLPLPRVNTNIVSPEDYHFAQLVDQLDTLDEYMGRSGLEVGHE